MLIQSQYVDNSKNEQEFFGIVSDMRNIPALLPEQAINVVADEDNLSFTVQGMGSIALRVSQRVTYSLVQLVPVGKVPFPFSLNIKIECADRHCRVMYVNKTYSHSQFITSPCPKFTARWPMLFVR